MPTDETGGPKRLRGGPVRIYAPTESALVRRSHNEITPEELWQILRRRKLIFFVSIGVATLAALILSLILPKRYEGVARLTVNRDSAESFELETLAQATGAPDSETKLQTQVHILRTDSLAWDVIRHLRLDQRPETAHQKFVVGPPVCVSGPAQPIESVSLTCRRLLLDEFHERLSVQSIPKTEIIEIRYACKSPELAALVVNTLADLYIERNFQSNYKSAMRVSGWLAGQLDEVERDTERAEEKYVKYQKETGIIGTDENHNVLIERLNAVNQQLMVAKAERIVREARYRVALTGDPEGLVGMNPGSKLQALHAQEVDLQNQYAQLDAKFGSAYPRVKQVKAALEKATEATREEINQTRGRIKTEYDAAQQSETLLRSEFERQKEQAYNTNEATLQVALLKRDVDASRGLYEQLVKTLKEAGIVAGLKANNVNVIDPAETPVRPVEPHPLANLALGMFAGSLCGVALCFVRETIDTRIATPGDVTEISSLPALAVVPNMVKGNGTGVGRIVPSLNGHQTHQVVCLEQPESEIADAYRWLRTSLLLSIPGTPPKVLLITSPQPREGKTTTSVNMAIVFAQKQRRVLLVDGDLRRADMHRYLQVQPNGGLSAALVGEDPTNFYVPHPRVPGLTMLPAGRRPPMPPDLLDSDRMRDLVTQWRQEFDQVIIDSPPVIGMSDAAILATMADTVLLVVRSHQSRRQELARAQEILSNVDARVGGAIINGFDMQYSGYYKDRQLYEHYFDGRHRRNGNEGA
jgi:capsular exopolysaccharide synthesis family protein